MQDADGDRAAPRDPREIYQNWLDTVSRATLAKDMDTLVAHIALPYQHQSLDMKLVIETRADLETGWHSFADFMLNNGVTDYIRLCTDAEFLSEDYLEGYHVAHMLRGAVPVVSPYANRMVLRRVGDTWKMIECFNGFYHKNWPLFTVESPTIPAGEELRAVRDDARREAAQPLTIYQKFHEVQTDATWDDDFETYASNLIFPYEVRTNTDVSVVENKEACRARFDIMREFLRRHSVTDFKRVASRAEFLSSSSLCGYHAIHIKRDSVDILPPIQSRSVLTRKGHRWYLHSSTNDIQSCIGKSNDILPGSGLTTEIDISTSRP